LIRILFRQDPAIRNLWSPIAWGILGGVIYRRLAHFAGDDLNALSFDTRGWITFCYGLAFFVCLLILFSANITTRTSRLLNNLPLKAKTLWLVRFTSILSTATLPLLFLTLTVSLRISGGGFTFHPYYLSIGLKGCSGLILAALLFQTPQPELRWLQPRREYIPGLIFSFVCILLFILLTPADIWPTLICLSAAIALVFYIYRSIPPTFLDCPTQLENPEWRHPTTGEDSSIRPHDSPPGEQTTGDIPPRSVDSGLPFTDSPVPPVAQAEEHEWSGSRILHWTLFRIIVNHWRTWLLGILCLLYSFLIPITFLDREIPIVPVLFISVWLVSIIYNGTIRIHRVDFLPISRKLLFAYVALPALAPIVFGLAIGSAVLLVRHEQLCQVYYGENGIEVPPEFWEIAWNEEPDRLTSPWGESLQPNAYHLFPGSRIVVYNPYETGKDNSAEFLALQANRAVAAILGETPFPEPGIEKDGFQPLVRLMSRKDEVIEGFPIPASVGKVSTIRLRAWLVGAIVIVAFWGVVGVVGLLKYRFSTFRRFFSILFITLIVLPCSAGVLHILLDIMRLSTYLNPLLFLAVLARCFAEALPFSNTILAVMLLVEVGLIYLLIERIFDGIEPPLNQEKPVWKEYG